MERIKLTKTEKQVLRELHRGNDSIPCGVDNFSYFGAVMSLSQKGLVKAETDFENVVDAKLTAKGYAYMTLNPRLLNPMDWIPDLVLVLSIMAAITSVSCLLILILNR